MVASAERCQLANVSVTFVLHGEALCTLAGEDHCGSDSVLNKRSRRRPAEPHLTCEDSDET